ncbi:hypothetical protein JCM3775_000159 [Rhodotorula graminis]
MLATPPQPDRVTAPAALFHLERTPSSAERTRIERARPVSRPPEARRKVLGSSHGPSSSSPTASASFASSRPIRARVDLGTSSPQAHASSTWTPSQPVRARVQLPPATSAQQPRGGAFSSAPSTPSTSSSPFARAGGDGTPLASAQGGVRATLSPRTPTAAASRAPSPVRARSPDAAAARPVVTRVGTTARVVKSDLTPDAKLLRGQSDPFPSASPSSSSSNTATPISYLPSSVSVRRLPSPRARPSSTLGASTSTTSSVDSSATLPALSTSPSSAASSPLASPNLGPHAFDHASSHARLSPVPHAYYDGSVGRKGAPFVRRLSGMSTASTSSSVDTGLLPPVSIAGDERRALPATSPALTPFPHSPPPLRSPSLQAFPFHAPTTSAAVRSPTISSFSSTRTVRASPAAPTSSAGARPSRPPSTASNPANARRLHARSYSSTSTSSLSSVFSPDERERASPFEPGQPWATAGPRSPVVGSPALHGPGAALAGIDWSAVAQLAELELDADAQLQRPAGGTVAAGRTSSGSEGPSASSSSVDGRQHEVDEAEKEARVARKIADLEIRNTSLLAINTTLERLKVKHTSEIRELRRRMRESVGGAGLAALRAHVSRLDENDLVGGGSDLDESDADDVDGAARAGAGAGVDDEPEPTWQELLEGDATFSALAATVESLIARGRRAVEYEPSKGETGRVLSTVEMEDRLQGGYRDEEEADDDELTPESSGRSTPATSGTSISTSRAADGAGLRSSERGLGIAGWQSARR